MPIVLFTDFGAGVYVGQLHLVLARHAPGIPVIDLLHDAPRYDAVAGAHLLAACLARIPKGASVIAVVDPGVGTARDAVVVECDGRHLVGPDNGLLSVCRARARSARVWSIAWRPPQLSASFHGRDLFAPVAAAIAAGPWPDTWLVRKPILDVELGADDVARIIYIDGYGNAWTGLRAAGLDEESIVHVAGVKVKRGTTFGDVPAGGVLWYENSLGLVEIAANRSSAAQSLNLALGDPVQVT